MRPGAAPTKDHVLGNPGQGRILVAERGKRVDVWCRLEWRPDPDQNVEDRLRRKPWHDCAAVVLETESPVTKRRLEAHRLFLKECEPARRPSDQSDHPGRQAWQRIVAHGSARFPGS